MRHPSEGTLRRLVDEPAGVADADREHVAECPACLSRLAAVREDAALVHAALDVEVTPDTGAAWQRLSGAVAVPARPAAARPARSWRWRAALRSPVVAVVGAVALLAGAGAAAATNWLQIFHAERITPVVAPEADLVKIPELDAFGDIRVTKALDIHPVSSRAAAEEATGLTLPRVGELPRGVRGEPEYHVGERVGAVFTFSAEKAAQVAAAAGGTLPPLPPGLDGAEFRLSAGPGVAMAWSEGRPVPAMMVVRAVAPTAYSEGIPFSTARDYLLAMPGLPENVASQLRNFAADGTTLPLFTSIEEQKTFTADVGGRKATVLSSRDEVFAGVVWVEDGVITAVGGSLSTDEVLSVARGLRWDR